MNRIYYFSSTGNTLAAAREFAAKLGDTELISIADLDRADEVDLSGADTVGIFFPVYCFGLPGIVQKFIRVITGSTHQYSAAVGNFAYDKRQGQRRACS